MPHGGVILSPGIRRQLEADLSMTSPYMDYCIEGKGFKDVSQVVSFCHPQEFVVALPYAKIEVQIYGDNIISVKRLRDWIEARLCRFGT